MALRGWRLFGVVGTIVAYVVGILLLSILSIQNHSPQRFTSRGFERQLSTPHGRELGTLGRRQPIRWCRELRYLDGRLPLPVRPPRMLHTFPGHPALIITTKPPPPPPLPPVSSSNEAAPHGKVVALASFPGSGNTWLRYLLQQATGILTGSVYKDYGLMKSGFPAESVRNSSVLVVKTHEHGPKVWQNFDRAILLVRDPQKAILAEFNRQSGGHVGFASPDRYKRTKGRYWEQFVRKQLTAWELMNLGWGRNFTGPLKVVLYDDLVADVGGTLRSVLHFLNWPIDENMFSCAMSRKEGIYQRKKRLMSFDPFTEEMKVHLEEKRTDVLSALGRQ
ncbi:WSCD family member AGAP003962 [Phlebotomus argentipes]|uniref:WSCD family member AGAP003962 n=1 Tax=Phlebotomus argentipes TaxID=94469 RepID=UPI00289353AB|nr:WSCD family member AGAP003962 [Phlebotomus argentipes]XP_059622701.1 WSCD family member AGAP003962 [Phlebotomus argentipes]